VAIRDPLPIDLRRSRERAPRTLLVISSALTLDLSTVTSLPEAADSSYRAPMRPPSVTSCMPVTRPRSASAKA